MGGGLWLHSWLFCTCAHDQACMWHTEMLRPSWLPSPSAESGSQRELNTEEEEEAKFKSGAAGTRACGM